MRGETFFAYFIYCVNADEIVTNHTTSAAGAWAEWTECTKECGSGLRARSSVQCDPECVTEEESCNMNDCAWSTWATGTCSKMCGPGLAVRSRECPEENHCIGSEKETVKCSLKACTSSSTWANWNEWGECSRTCGPFGKRERKRSCNGHGCSGQTLQVWGCNRNVACKTKWIQKSQPTKSWENWKGWSRCVGSCPDGTQTRYRHCQLGWLKCTGPVRESQTCKMHNCNSNSVSAPQVSNQSRSVPRPWAAAPTQPPSNQGKHQPEKIVKVAGNLIGNGHCEEEPDTWGAIENFYCNSCNAVRWTADAHDGASSMKISGRKASWAGINYSFGMGIADGASYLFVGWIKVLKWGSHEVMVTAKIEGDGKPQYLNQITDTVSGYNWAKIQGNVEVTGGAVTLYIEGLDKGTEYLIDQFSLVRLGGPAKPQVNTGPATDTTDEKLRDPGFEISPNWGAGWGCQGCTGVPITFDVKQGKRAMKVTNREDTWAGPVQKLKYGPGGIRKNVVYTASMWVKSIGTDKNMDTYELTVKIDYRLKTKKDVWLKFGKLCTVPGEWGILSGEIQITVDPSLVSVLEFYVEGPEKSRDFIVDNASFKVASVPSAWIDESDKKINEIRKANLSIRTFYDSDVTVSIEQTKHAYPFGSAVDSSLLVSNQQYRNFFMDNFNIAVLENKLKWKQIEQWEGNRNFAEADRAIALLEKANIPIRGHAAVWAVDKFVPKWLTLSKKSKDEKKSIVKRHVEDVVGRYKNRLVHWDVNNEMLHGSFFEKTIGGNIRADMFKWAKLADPNAQLFVNDYEIISGGLTNCYKEQIKELLSNGAPIDGIGVQCHFKDAERNVNPIQVTDKFNSLAELGLPIWVTEFDVSQSNPIERAKHMEYFMRAAFSHPSVEGLLFWGYWDQRHWRGKQASLVDGHNFVLNAAGKKYRELVFDKWWSKETHTVSTGVKSTRIFKGDYTITIKDNNKILETRSISVTEAKDICFGDKSKCSTNVAMKAIAQKSSEENMEGSGTTEVDF